MNITIERPVTVITPTIGSAKLADCIQSVLDQSYKSIKHLIVVDGPEYDEAVASTLVKFKDSMRNRIQLVALPENVGKGFYGHRVYASFPHLVNSDYIALCDEDNFYQPDHIRSLVDVLESEKGHNIHYAYSFRRIVDSNGAYLLDDDCESLGDWPIWVSQTGEDYLIDTSSYLFRRDFLIRVCQHWHHGWGADRKFLASISAYTGVPSYKYTLNYRLDGNPNSVSKEFFEQGNKAYLEYFKGQLPWKK